MPRPESEIIAKAVAGDVHAFRALVEKHQTFVLRLAYRFVRNIGDAEDITQEAFIRVWKNLHRYKPDVKLTTWMYTIVTNLCLDHLKSSRFRSSRTTGALEEELNVQSTMTSDQTLVAKELRGAIIKLTEELTPKQKATFVLRDLEELEADEVCRILNESPDKIKSNLYYARKKMGELIQKYYGTDQNEML